MENNHLKFSQDKLTKNEWEYIEIPLDKKEKVVVDFIKDSFYNTDNILYPFESLLNYLKLYNNNDNDTINKIYDDYFIDKYLKNYILQILLLIKTYNENLYNIYNTSGSNKFIRLKVELLKNFDNFDIDIDNISINYKNKNFKNIKKKDLIRINNIFSQQDKDTFINNDKIYEFVCLKQIINILLHIFNDVNTVSIISIKYDYNEVQNKINKYNKNIINFEKNKQINNNSFYRLIDDFNNKVIDKLYALHKILNFTIQHSNNKIINFVKYITQYLISNISNKKSFENIGYWIENNELLNHYSVLSLYDHQKSIFNIFNKQDNNKIVYYCASTGTGKTLSPIALACKYKIIFVCAARHIGLSFARNAISCGFKIALAFNCNDAEDIRLHYSAAKVYTKNYKSGGIHRVDNTIGDKVEIIISDLKSYSYAAYYMSAFNDVKDIITFWDEPTISLDYNAHILHSLIHKNWNDNVIPNMVLSSATLPSIETINTIFENFSKKFKSTFNYIKTYDYRKTICIYDTLSNITTPHSFLKNRNTSYDDFKVVIKSFKNDMTLLRYLHINSCVDFINSINDEFLYNEIWYELTTDSIKKLYLTVLDNIDECTWNNIKSNNFIDIIEHKYYTSTKDFMTNDSYTLTNGPTIYLTNDVFEISKLCLKTLNIKQDHLTYLYENVNYNNVILNKIKVLEKSIEDEKKKGNLDKKERKMEKILCNDDNNSKIRQLNDKIDRMYNSMKKIHIPEVYIPNSYEHLNKYTSKNYKDIYKKNREIFTPFTSSLTSNDIQNVLSIHNIDDELKLLLLCGIGVVSDMMCNEYNIIINKLASEEKLFMLIASSDYIYGTNYSFHHGYLGNDMVHNSRQKNIQAIGRIGRGNTNQHYSIRVCDDEIIHILFNEYINNSIEAYNMNKLFYFEELSNEELCNYEQKNTQENIETAYNSGWIVETIEENNIIDAIYNDNSINNIDDEDDNITIDNWEELIY